MCLLRLPCWSCLMLFWGFWLRPAAAGRPCSTPRTVPWLQTFRRRPSCPTCGVPPDMELAYPYEAWFAGLTNSVMDRAIRTASLPRGAGRRRPPEGGGRGHDAPAGDRERRGRARHRGDGRGLGPARPTAGDGRWRRPRRGRSRSRSSTCPAGRGGRLERAADRGRLGRRARPRGGGGLAAAAPREEAADGDAPAGPELAAEGEPADMSVWGRWSEEHEQRPGRRRSRRGAGECRRLVAAAATRARALRRRPEPPTPRSRCATRRCAGSPRRPAHRSSSAAARLGARGAG